MPRNLTPICVRLDPETLHLLNALQRNQRELELNRVPRETARPYNRSELIRHAITAGLDVLTSEPTLIL